MLLKINSDAFGAEHNRVEKRDKTGHLEQTAGRNHVLQPAEEIKHRPTVRDHQLAIHPVGEIASSQPRATMEKEKRKPDAEEQKALQES